MSTFTSLQKSLRAMDAARPITADQKRHAASVLDRIVATAPDAPAPARSGRRPRRRLRIVSAATAVAVSGALVILLGGIDDSQAYASWTPVPAALAPDEIARIGPECLDGLGKAPLPFDRDRAQVALAERRGEYAVLMYRSETPSTAVFCLAHNLAGSDDVDKVVWGAASATGSSETVPARGYTQGALADLRGASITEGAVGADVVGLTVHAHDLTVQATVTGGRYVAWWPGPAFGEDTERLGGKGGPEPFISYDLTLRDGVVLHDAAPARP